MTGRGTCRDGAVLSGPDGGRRRNNAATPNLWCRARELVPAPDIRSLAGPAGNAIPRNGEGLPLRDAASAAPRRMSCSDTSTSLEPERADASRGRHAGDDRRRAVGVQAGRPRGAARRHRGQARRAAPRASPAARTVAVHPRRVVGLELQSIAAADVACPRRRSPPATLSPLGRELRRATSRAKSSASARSSSGSGGSCVQVALAQAHDAGLRRDVEVHLRPWPTTNSVEPPPMSMTTAVRRRAARSVVAPRKVSRASSSPVIVRASMPKRSRPRR